MPFGLLAPKIFYIIWLSNLSTLSVPDEDDSRNALCALNLISTFLLNTLRSIQHLDLTFRLGEPNVFYRVFYFK
jgi:hypothetical protein